ncbi:hypothetical protein DLJ53_24035 [Acuticoccus sediminis]|uniref:Carboxypeptidase regulatory-like domain-containing protein n=1 Tax=Acuticoccus sediminis TaxID=2184697 RepID=A0A8B2NR46_9HYPH|nr:hypothetical protein [Acuticoccus sediminis]RAH98716.1 hypothetical protein DLJ53_24035 [Acuticoccus sediminis]
MGGGDYRGSSQIAAYAPSTPTRAELRPDVGGEVALYLVGKLAEKSGPIGSGVTWRVYRDQPTASGQLPLVEKASGGDLELRLQPGRYVVHASYGRAAVTRTIDLYKPVTSETLVLNAGGLQLAAVLDESNQPVSKDTEFQLYMVADDDRVLLGDIRAGAIARLPAGTYHVVSRYGGINAVRSADVTVDAGKLTRVSLRHSAGKVRLKLVRDTGGEALANTSWTVYSDDGQPIYERVGAHANITLAAGNYEVVAHHRDTEFRRSFTVKSGDESDVVVQATRL